MSARVGFLTHSGFTYIGLLLFIAIFGIGFSVIGMSWEYQVRSEKEKQLLFVGSEFRKAINSYYTYAPDAIKVYPSSLNDLLLDRRVSTIKRHLRKIYVDPMTGQPNWFLLKEQGRIIGIYSRSNLVPFKKTAFDEANAGFAFKKSYQEWIFNGKDLRAAK